MKLDPTAAPRRSAHPPREGVPVPTIDPGDVNEHWRKHPSDYHADNAVGAMSEAAGERDSATRDYRMKVAEVNAMLSVRDALLEAVATVRETAGLATEAHAELSQTVKKATNAVVIEMRKATVKEAEAA